MADMHVLKIGKLSCCVSIDKNATRVVEQFVDLRHSSLNIGGRTVKICSKQYSVDMACL